MAGHIARTGRRISIFGRLAKLLTKTQAHGIDLAAQSSNVHVDDVVEVDRRPARRDDLARSAGTDFVARERVLEGDHGRVDGPIAPLSEDPPLAGSGIIRVHRHDASPAESFLRLVRLHGRPDQVPESEERGDSDQQNVRLVLHRQVLRERATAGSVAS